MSAQDGKKVIGKIGEMEIYGDPGFGNPFLAPEAAERYRAGLEEIKRLAEGDFGCVEAGRRLELIRQRAATDLDNKQPVPGPGDIMQRLREIGVDQSLALRIVHSHDREWQDYSRDKRKDST